MPVLRQELHAGDIPGEAHAEARGAHRQAAAYHRLRPQASATLDGPPPGALLAQGQPRFSHKRAARAAAAPPPRQRIPPGTTGLWGDAVAATASLALTCAHARDRPRAYAPRAPRAGLATANAPAWPAGPAGPPKQ